MHLQDTVNNWTDCIPRLPDRVLVKAVKRPDMLRTAKQIRPGCITLLRHHYDDNQTYDFASYATKLDRAKNYFDAFLDGTFYEQYKALVDIIGLWNEVWAESQTAQEKADRVEQERAFIEVFNRDHKSRLPAHVRLQLSSAAVGNSQPIEMYHLSRDTGHYLGYHPYTWWGDIDGDGDYERAANDWVDLSGRCFEDERRYGVKAFYCLDEGGPFESAISGWKAQECLGNDIGRYVTAVRELILDIQETPAYQEGRVVGPVALFTTGRTHPIWQSFWTEQPELNALADMIKVEWKPGTVTLPPNPLPGLRLAPPFHESFIVSSPFDAPRDYGKHEGTDYVATVQQGNELIHCGYDGTVDVVAYSATGYGKYIRVKHLRNGGTFYTYYAHLDTQLVAVGNIVKAGDPLGEVGSTGNSTGPHVHITLRVPNYGASGYVVPDVVNPDPYVDRWVEPPRQYKRVCHLLPGDANMAEYNQVIGAAYPLRQTVLFSIDDAMINHPNLTSRTVIVWGALSRHGAFTDRASFEAWIVANYPPLPILEYRAF